MNNNDENALNFFSVSHIKTINEQYKSLYVDI